MKITYRGWGLAAIGMLVSVGLGTVFYTLVISPTIKENTNLQQRINAKESRLARVKARTKRLTKDAEELRAEVDRIQKNTRNIRKKHEERMKDEARIQSRNSITRASRLANIQSDLKTIADAMGLGITSITRDKDIIDGRLIYGVFQVSLTGTYSQLTDWMSSATLGDARICDVRSCTLRRLKKPTSYFKNAQTNPAVQLNFIATLFCAALGTEGAIPTIEYKPYSKSNTWKVLKPAYIEALASTVERSPFTPRLFRDEEAASSAMQHSNQQIKETKRTDDENRKDSVSKGWNTSTKTSTPTSPVTVTPAPKTPLTASALTEYAVLAIIERSGIRTAVVMLPDGQAKPVRLDSRIGVEGGIVADITKDSLIIDIPTKSEPVTLIVQE